MSQSQHPISRRTLLRAAAGGTAMLASQGLPAWARPIHHHTPLRRPDSLPFGHLPAGIETMHEIRHVVVLIMENHSFDSFFGAIPELIPARRDVDGLTFRKGRATNANRGHGGVRHRAARAATPCQLDALPTNAWNASHQSYDHGRNDGFVRASGPVAMWYWDQLDLPFTYSLARHFPIGNRFFCSALAQTYPNRRFFFTGTASGTTSTDATTFSIPAANGTIWDRLDAHGIDWGIYYNDLPSWLIVPGSATAARAPRVREYSQFASDVAAGRLPQFTFLDPNYKTESQEDPQDVQVGEEFMAGVVRTLMRGPSWRHTALFITYDEHGGYYDHVPPPRAVEPDSIAPILKPGDAPGGYERYGFRVPLIVISPWAKPGYVSNVTQDLTSLTAFIERKWNLPAMTFRDANADPMTDYFDFRHAAFKHPPRLHAAPGLAPGLAKCQAAGLNPPLPDQSSEPDDVARYLHAQMARTAAR